MNENETIEVQGEEMRTLPMFATNITPYPAADFKDIIIVRLRDVDPRRGAMARVPDGFDASVALVKPLGTRDTNKFIGLAHIELMQKWLKFKDNGGQDGTTPKQDAIE